jgi:hypothetical protein
VVTSCPAFGPCRPVWFLAFPEAVPTGIDDDFLHQLARARGASLSQAEVKALQHKLLGRA